MTDQTKVFLGGLWVNEDKNGKKYIGFGLDEENIRRLKNKEPILVDMSIFGIDANILIFYERTSDELLNHIAPYIDKETKIHES